ncbi:MAG: DNA-processing protein DprA [Sphaerochaetaceae bacterium]|nr:DNA-protecting protein DprA [Sphaerochaetaceae bacterium]
MDRALTINSLDIPNKGKKELFKSSISINEILKIEGVKKSLNLEKEVNECSNWLIKNRGFKRGKLTIFDLDYPRYLKQFDDCPFLFFYEGQMNYDIINSICIVGTRKPTKIASQKAYEFGFKCGFNKKNVISGFAKGCDQSSMFGCLEGGGKVCGVLGCGIDYPYPSNSKNLKLQLLKTGGCIISQYPPLSPPLYFHFPQRNIILAGLSLKLLVIEAPIKSGALITSRYALNQSTEVFVHKIGTKNTVYCEGSRNLVEDGATLVSSYEDIFAH